MMAIQFFLGTKFARIGVACFMWGLLTCVLLSPAIAVPPPTPQEPTNVEIQYQDAAVAEQGRSNFELASEHWNRLLKEFPNTKLRTSALGNLGLCEAQTGDFKAATEHLGESINTTPADQKKELARRHFFLGYSHFQLGNAAVAANDEQESNRQLTTASTIFDKVLVDYPEFEGLHEAAYFRAMALEKLLRNDEAIKSYQRVLDFPESNFLHDALFALGDLNARKKDNTASANYLREYLDSGNQLPAANDVRLMAGDVIWKLAQVAKGENNDAEFTKLADEAALLWNAAANDGNFSRRDEAEFNLALMEHSRGNTEAAIKGFQKIADRAESPMMPVASMNLGHLLMLQNKTPDAIVALEKSVASAGPHSLEAAHKLAQAYLASNDPTKAFELAQTWAAKAVDVKLKSELLMDVAEAALNIPEKQVDSVGFFKQVADLEQDNAAIATYNAAYAALGNKDFEQALSLAEQFEKKFVVHEFMADALEVRAEALMSLERPQDAVPVFDRLIADFTENKKWDYWLVRNSVAHYAAEDFAGVEKGLTQIEKMVDPTRKAEAYHWLGMARVRQNQTDLAIKAFQQSIASGTWSLQSETLLGLAKAQLTRDDVGGAEATVAQLEKDFAASSEVPQALYALAQYYQKNGDAQKAEALFAKVAGMENAGAFSGYALLNKAYQAFDADDFSAAKRDFDSVLAGASQDPVLANKARLGLASVFRLQSEFTQAIENLDLVIKSPSTPAELLDAQYELGLVQVAAQDWPAAITTFEKLSKQENAAGIIAKVRYEWAWALQNADRGDEAREQFAILATDFGDTTMGADAQFQLAEHDYRGKKFVEAIERYSKLMANAPDVLKEKTLYKMGWAQYRLGEFEKANAAFQKQADDFKDGLLYADALYMIAESSFKQEKFDAAFAAYTAARPVMESSKSIERENVWLGILHAAQSANKLKKYTEAKELAAKLADDSEVNNLLRWDANLELGTAAYALKDLETALAAWRISANDNGVTGAKSRYLLGADYFTQKAFDKAIVEFSLVINGFGGAASDADVDPWQALATYEIARCTYEQAKLSESIEQRKRLVKQSIGYFEELVEKYPTDALVAEAKRQIGELIPLLNK